MKTLITIAVGLSFLLLTTGAYADESHFELRVLDQNLDKYDATGQDRPAVQSDKAEMKGADETWDQIRPEVVTGE